MENNVSPEMQQAEIEKIKLKVVDYLASADIKGAVNYVRKVASVGLVAAMHFIQKVQKEVEPD